MDSCSKPNLFLVAKLILFLFTLFSLTSSENVSAMDHANAPLSQMVKDFCKDNNYPATMISRWDHVVCLEVFRSDPRSATVSDKATFAKLGMELAQSSVEKIEVDFSSQTTNPPNQLLKPVLESCVDGYQNLLRRFNFFSDFAASGEYEKIYSWDYDFSLCSHDISKCRKDLDSVVPRDELLVKKSQLICDYYEIGFAAASVIYSLLRH